MGLALGLRRVRGAPPLWMLVVAAQGPDWGDALRELVGRPMGDPAWEPHGLIPLGIGALLAAAAAACLVGRGTRRIAALLVGGAYAAHWLCDFVTAYKPTWPGGPQVGLDLYTRPLTDFVVEATCIVVGWALWRRSLPRVALPRPTGAGAPRDAVGTAATRLVPVALLVSLVVLQALANRALVAGLRMGIARP